MSGMRSSRAAVSVVCVVLLLLLHAQCDVTAMRRSLVSPQHLSRDAKSSDVLKAHMHNGDVYVFSDWSENPAGHVTGYCNHYNPQRRLLATGQQTIAIDSVVIFETNRVRPSGSIAALTVITGISLAMTAICIANPKTCFGSCPTFYVLDRPDPLLQAEGFSSSIAPCLEATDCDALYRTDATGAELAIRMNNEALETHVVRRVDLLCVPRPDRGRVYTTADNRFFAAAPAVPLSRAVGSDGDCTTLLDAFDGIERKSNADPESLVSPETIDLYFDNPPTGPLGLVIATRQSLLSTYLFYQSLAYLGTEAGAWMASLERGRADAHEGARALGGQLGQIAVAVQSDAGDWDTVSSVGETGPLATNTYVVPLPEGSARDGHVRLTMTRGHWRID
ncbi:MAG TPA: hypothetical protein VLB27_07195, partial [candidate division Zixibacteria bacterium]|nr:hypothetical protein [candidate division Zixibacteria bacterium]